MCIDIHVVTNDTIIGRGDDYEQYEQLFSFHRQEKEKNKEKKKIQRKTYSCK